MNAQFWSFILSVSLLNVSQSLDYSDVEALGLNCPIKISCAALQGRSFGVSNNHDGFTSRNCECDAQCATYNDCCIDAKQRHASRPQRGLACMPYGGYTNQGVYVVNTCAKGWTGPAEVKRRCQANEDLRDPLNAAPLTSYVRNRTYRNRYCAECNDAAPSSLVTWLIEMDCPNLPLNISDANVWSNLEWSEGSKQWGVYRWNPGSSSRVFYTCNLRFGIPPSVNDSVRLCRPNLVSTCPNSWRRVAIRRNCAAYTAVVYEGHTIYRNPHCAICHGLAVDQFTCADRITSRQRPLSFALLLDINQSDGDQVGVSRQSTPRCPSGEKYDPYFKKCRSLVCALPGYKMKNGNCVPE